MRVITKLTIALSLAVISTVTFADGWDSGTNASNTSSIANTRHNMTVSYLTPASQNTMSGYMTNYDNQVCVYCHTPHGAETSQVQAPLWNRRTNGSYTLYDKALTSGQVPTTPGTASLTCLSCHDGTVAIDALINMPGTGYYTAADIPTDGFLDTWRSDNGAFIPGDHSSLSIPGERSSCLQCHDRDINGANGTFGAFNVFVIGEDLRNDHPVGVEFPAADHPTAIDFKQTNLKEITGKAKYFDNDANSKMDKQEVRMYASGGATYEVECASCHDPHGVMPTGGSEFNPSFLRVANSQSALCLTCHDK